jgi:methylmalonyl-CoA mutase C-terminal domain/subunit
MELLRQNGLDDVLVVVGGIVPEADAEALRQAGVAAVFPPGSRMEEIIGFIQTHVPLRPVA